MKLYLTMGDDGKGVLTHKEPIVRRVEGTRRRGVYAQPGDAVLVKGLCREWVEKVLGRVPKPCEPVEIRMNIGEIK